VKKRIARLLRRGANRLDPLPPASFIRNNTFTGSNAGAIRLTYKDAA
jgi:hypothetical protein